MTRVWCFAILLIAVACTKKQATSDAPPTTEELAEKGKQVYSQYCIACHNTNPEKVGATGPAIKGSSLELLQARVLTNNYPPGYKPQRNTTIMPPFKYLEKDIPALHAFLK